MKNAFTAYDIFATRGEVGMISKDPHFPCSAVGSNDRVREMCYYVQPLLTLQLYDGDFDRVVSACLEAPIFMRPYCIAGVGFSAATPPALPSAYTVFSICDKAPKSEAYVKKCAAGAIEMFVYMWGSGFESEARTFCTLFEEHERKTCLAYLESLKE